MIGPLGFSEAAVLLCMALMIFGGKGLPKAAKQVGKVLRDLRHSFDSWQEDEPAVHEPLSGPDKENKTKSG